MAKRTVQRDGRGHICRGSGNVFADLKIPDAQERQMKLRLAKELNSLIQAQGLIQEAVAGRLNLNRRKVSALRNYKLNELSGGRLMTLRTALDRDIEIVIREKPKSRGARISLAVA